MNWDAQLSLSTNRTNEDDLLFNLSVLGGIEDQQGRVWKCDKADVYMFDGNFFTQVSAMREARAAAGCAMSSEGNIVVAGGFVTEGEGTARPLSSVEIYNPVKDTWVEGSF